MRYLFVTDIHSTSLGPLETVIGAVEPDVVAVLGDYDKRDILRELKNLETKLRCKQGIDVYVLPGNHDDAIFHNSPQIDSAEIPITSSFDALVQEYRDDQEMQNYLRQIVYSLSKQIKIEDSNGNKYDVLLFHGALDATEETNRKISEIDTELKKRCTRPVASHPAKNLWYRLRTLRDHAQNFAAMQRKGHQILIRGHDHDSEHVSFNPQETEVYSVKKCMPEVLIVRKPYDIGAEEAAGFLGQYTVQDYGNIARIIEPGLLHTITIGAYSGSHFGILDTGVQIEDGSKKMVFYFCGFEDWFSG